MNKQILGDIKVKTVIYVKKNTTTTTTDRKISDVPEDFRCSLMVGDSPKKKDIHLEKTLGDKLLMQQSHPETREQMDAFWLQLAE